eukprot:TRINITY_DN35869_c0_g1_i1.p1 TRINITY_DN35869_c0_g1~~TRINITY_DN35869_c0_g1_i1.p1  ORF type:complete len:576 (+),score=90.97 TRINITY_DN35869_c0_g1_i1:79-1806(+)
MLRSADGEALGAPASKMARLAGADGAWTWPGSLAGCGLLAGMPGMMGLAGVSDQLSQAAFNSAMMGAMAGMAGMAGMSDAMAGMAGMGDAMAGLTGAAGLTSAAGLTGATGLAGAAGLTGAAGLAGAAGLTAEQFGSAGAALSTPGTGLPGLASSMPRAGKSRRGGFHDSSQATEAEEPITIDPERPPPAGYVIGYVEDVFPNQGVSRLRAGLPGELPLSEAVLLPEAVAQPSELREAKAVIFSAVRNENGELEATGRVWALQGRVSGAIGWYQYNGCIERTVASGDGFVNSPEIMTQFGQNAYAYRKVMLSCGLSLHDEIQFDIHVNSRNQTQVQAPVWRKVQGSGHVGVNLEPPPNTDQASDFMFAVVKRTFPEKGFSFLTQDPTNEDAQSIYVHNTVADPGTLSNPYCKAVAFKPHVNTRGETQASSPVWLYYGQKDSVDDVAWSQFIGVIVNVNSNGEAFVRCPELETQHGMHAYVDRETASFSHLGIGDLIRFDAHINEQGKCQVQVPLWKKHAEAPRGKGGPGGPNPATVLALLKGMKGAKSAGRGSLLSFEALASVAGEAAQSFAEGM